MGNVIDMQFLPIKLPPVYDPPFFYKSTHIALDENHRGNCSGLMVPTYKILVLAHRLKGENTFGVFSFFQFSAIALKKFCQ